MNNSLENFNTGGLLNSQLPHNLEAEQSVLGAIILDPSCLNDLIQNVKSEYFYKPLNKEIYTVMVSMFSSNEPIDIVSLMEKCIRNNIFNDESSAKLYLANLAQTVPSISNIAVYSKIIQDKFYVRSLMNTATEILAAANENTADAQELLDFAEQKIYDIRKGKDSVGIRKIDEVIVSAYDHLQKISGEDKELYKPASTGFTGLDNIITGLSNSDLVLIAARPGVGKTAFVVNMATNVAKKTKKDVVLFNLEMGAEQLVTRMLSSESGI
ncbi:MAG: DnaB-like helicase N-terminal domain-containing protein, partial [Oscillospiraceae bacterium]